MARIEEATTLGEPPLVALFNIPANVARDARIV